MDYTVDGVDRFLGAEAAAALGREQTVPALLACRRESARTRPDPLAAAVLLWLIGEDLPAGTLDAAFPRTGAGGLVELGLAEPAGDAADPAGAQLLRAAADLRPYATAGAEPGAGTGLWVASDLGEHQRPGVLRRDHVLGIGQASLSLAQLTVRRPVERALDLGTGCGIQVFHLLEHCRHVTATDISERALAFTRFNLVLNAAALGLDPDRLEDRIDLRLGSLLEPVAGRQFDLVVSNPPFVITPRTGDGTADERFTYRDGGLPGDDIVSSLVRGLQDVLAPGGTAQMLGNWEIPGPDASDDGTPSGVVPAAEDAAPSDDEAAPGWADRIRSWLPPELEAWVIQREALSPAEYAEMWLRDAAENRDRQHYARAYEAYLADFASRGVQAVGFGSLWLRRSAGTAAQPRLRRFEEITHPLEQPLGPHLGAAVERFDWAAARPSLTAEHLTVADDVTEERHQRPGAEHPGVILLRQGAGFRRTNLMSTELAGFVSASDGELTAGQIIAALGALLGRDDEEFAAELEAEVRNLVLDGFLLPAD